MKPRRPENVEEILAERLAQALGEDDPVEKELSRSSLDSFDEAWPQPFENSQRMWSFDRTVTIEKPLVTFPRRSIGFYALIGQSVITFKEKLVKETIVEALEEIREQNPVERILLVADKRVTSRETHTTASQRTRHRVRLHSTVFADVERNRTTVERLQMRFSPTIFDDRDHFRAFLIERFLRLSQRLSFAVDRINTFLLYVQKLR